MSHPNAAYLEKYLAPLEGATITRVKVAEPGFDEAWPVLDVTLADGIELELEIGADEEGNGPGFIFGLPYPDSES